MKRSTTGLCATAMLLSLTLAACGKPDEQGSTTGESSPSAKEQAADLREKAEQKAIETARKAEETAAEAAARQVGSATQAAGEKAREAGEAISDKALSQPERVPAEEPGGTGPADYE
ncbi:MAG: hypothetical protein ACOY42_00430 [Pseudomonadota bacterium]